jgi:xanthine dehydrogenase accessory factor
VADIDTAVGRDTAVVSDTAAGRVGIAEVARAVLSASDRRAVAGRVVDIQGFSTWAGDELIVVDETGAQHGDVLGRHGATRMREASGALLAAETPRLGSVTVEIHGADVIEAGLSCGGRAELLLQPTAGIPVELWEHLARRAPVALLTRLDGPGASIQSVVVAADGTTWGTLPGDGGAAVAEATRLLAGGAGATRRVEDADGTVLVEAWVPTPRLVVIGAGDLVGAITAQAALLGWETTSLDGGPERSGPGSGPAPGVPGGDWPALDEALTWAGASAALVVLSHNPHVDVPALGAGLDRGLPYIGAMGSRKTQSRRLERLEADGRTVGELDRIHRPIGLDLGGRAAPEVALAICAEILASHCGRDGRPLKERTGPINDRPTAGA